MTERTNIYYWKCDRTAAFQPTVVPTTDDSTVIDALAQALAHRFPDCSITIESANNQGSHGTYKATIHHASKTASQREESVEHFFIRTKQGPEPDSYFFVEDLIITKMSQLGVPVARVVASDSTCSITPFPWQALELLSYPDLNRHFKAGTLAFDSIAVTIGENIARWQEISPPGFGPFSVDAAQNRQTLTGLHRDYATYYNLNLARHIDFLVQRQFITSIEAASIREAIKHHTALLGLKQGCLVHKDLALWNILGTPERIVAFIDWDDVIVGDPLDDFSLLACFHDSNILVKAFEGYTRIRALPEQHMPRLWLHLLRNMLVKAVIRVGAGYFKHNDNFFLIGSGTSGADLRTFTRQRLFTALRGLQDNCDITILNQNTTH